MNKTKKRLHFQPPQSFSNRFQNLLLFYSNPKRESSLWKKFLNGINSNLEFMSKHTDQTLAAGGSSPVCDRVLPGLSFVLRKRAVQVTSPRESDGYMGSRECLQGSGGQCSSISPPSPWPLSLQSSLEPHPTRSEYQVEESGHLLKLPPCGASNIFFLGRTEKRPEVVCHCTGLGWPDELGRASRRQGQRSWRKNAFLF